MTSIFEPLRLIGEDIYLHEPPGNDSSGGPGTLAPALVVLCTWAGGATPAASTISTALPILSSSFNHDKHPRHCFSAIQMDPTSSQARPPCNPSGLGVAVRRRRALGHRGPTWYFIPFILSWRMQYWGTTIPRHERRNRSGHGISFSRIRGIILDCSPGDDAFERSYRAALLSVPQNTIAQFVSGTILYPSLSVLNGLQNAGFIRAVRDLRLALNDPNTFGTDAKRLYIYSKEDVMVGWEDVQSHFEEARSQGYTADQIVFESGSHCTLMVEDADRYWKAVQRFWEGGDLSALSFNPAPSGAISTSRNQPHSRSRL
ncbi:hypothetical protein N7481_005393 [Penicillium waksmanii]|uniref:uncharacterized protein n=1 Tax=Penicillium waksmanii TaxID=69791 RepID=UPI0025466393|nr:uncharacterized protein N7481_005393 [Penicillium waksmanii]KAJ5983294.1 hypothetical protein N7481_005393 [Penicillium waksmanii]